VPARRGGHDFYSMSNEMAGKCMFPLRRKPRRHTSESLGCTACVALLDTSMRMCRGLADGRCGQCVRDIQRGDSDYKGGKRDEENVLD